VLPDLSVLASTSALTSTAPVPLPGLTCENRLILKATGRLVRPVRFLRGDGESALSALSSQ
jgi:hypothetical protein